MPLRSVEAASRDDAIAAAREQFGPHVRVVGVRRVRSGGVLGFFATERYVAEVDPDHPSRAAGRDRESTRSTAVEAAERAASARRAEADAVRQVSREARAAERVSELAGLLASDHPGQAVPTYSRASVARPREVAEPIAEPLAADTPFDAAWFEAFRAESARTSTGRSAGSRPASSSRTAPAPSSGPSSSRLGAPRTDAFRAEPARFQPARVESAPEPARGAFARAVAEPAAAGAVRLRGGAVAAAPAPWSSAAAAFDGTHATAGNDDDGDGQGTGESAPPSPFTAALARMVAGDRDVRQAVRAALDDRDAEQSALESPRPTRPRATGSAATPSRTGAGHQEEESVTELGVGSPSLDAEARPAEAVSRREEAIAEVLRSALEQGHSDEALADILRKVLASTAPQVSLPEEPAVTEPSWHQQPQPLWDRPSDDVELPADAPIWAEVVLADPAAEKAAAEKAAAERAAAEKAAAERAAAEKADAERAAVEKAAAEKAAAERAAAEKADAERAAVEKAAADEAAARAAEEAAAAAARAAEEAAAAARAAEEAAAARAAEEAAAAAARAAEEAAAIRAAEEAAAAAARAAAETAAEEAAAAQAAEEAARAAREAAAVRAAEEAAAARAAEEAAAIRAAEEAAAVRAAEEAAHAAAAEEEAAHAAAVEEERAAITTVAAMARTASDPAPMPLDATSVMPPLSLLPPLPGGGRRGGLPPVPPAPSRQAVATARPAATAPVEAGPVVAPPAAAPKTLATVVRLHVAPPAREQDAVEPAPTAELPSTPTAATEVRSSIAEPVDAAIPAPRTPVSPEPAPALPVPAVTSGTGPQLVSKLRALGIPELLLGPAFVADTEAHGTYAALTHALGSGLPPAPPVPEGAGEVLFVVGPGVDTLRAARSLAASLRLDPDRVQWATRGDLAGLAPKSMTTIETAVDRRTEALAAGTVTVVAVDAPLRTDAYWMAQMLAIWAPVAVWAVVDATRKPEDVEPWIAGLPRVDALMVQDTDLSADPAAVLDRVAVPVALLDGAPATPHRWASLLCERLEKQQT